MNKAALFSLILLPGILTGCKQDPAEPEKLIPEADYQHLLIEVFMTHYMVELEEIEEKRDSMMNVLFERYELTAEEFDRIHRYYQQDPGRQLERIDRINEILKQEREALEEGKENYLRQTDEQRQNQPAPDTP